MTRPILLDAQAALRAGLWSDAERHLASALSVNPNDDVALALSGELRVAQNRLPEAILNYAHAVALQPDTPVYRERFAELAKPTVVARWSPVLGNAMLACLKTQTFDCAGLWRFWYSLVIAEPRFREGCDLAGRKNFAPENEAEFAKITRLDAFTSSLFVHGLSRLIVYEPLFEQFLCRLRHQLLLGPGRRSRELTSFAAAIALYAFHTGYILDASEEENSAVTALRHEIETDGGQAMGSTAVAVLASYVPLWQLGNAARIGSAFGRTGPLKALVREQIGEPAELRTTAKNIPSLGAIGAGISTEVQQQYEEFPYPRWEILDQAKLLRDWQAQEATANTERKLSQSGARILVLGCGTGRETALLATLFPSAQITAVDLSRASIAYAQLKARQKKLANIRFYQADILNLAKLEPEFDYICATGVLHHMDDPALGWEISASLLKPGGLMRVGLYSETARTAVVSAREVIAKTGYGSDEQEMRRFRRDSPALFPQTVLDELIGFTDYYQLSMYRDLLFHVQEHRFTLPRISEITCRLRLQFLGFYLSNDVLRAYSSEFPADRDRTDLHNWEQFESRHPHTFRNMYVFWCRKAAQEAV